MDITTFADLLRSDLVTMVREIVIGLGLTAFVVWALFLHHAARG